MNDSRGRAADLALGAAVFLARMPFLGDGWGADPDAWRVAWAGRLIRATGEYHAARAPGNPIPEFAAAALAPFGAGAYNALTALCSAAAAVLFGQLLRRLGVRAWWAGALALAFTPVVAIHSADAMDYVWALAFVLAALRLALEGRAAAAGLALGLAAGCRVTSLALLPALSVALGALAPARPGLRAHAALWLVALAATAAAFAPAMAQGGLSFLHGYETGYPPLRYVLKNATVDVWGIAGCAALALAAFAAWRARGGAERPAMPRGVLAAAVLGIALELALFLRLPHEAAYLIPAVPLALLLVAAAVPKRAFVAVAALLALSSFTLEVSESGKADGLGDDALALRFGAGGRPYVLHLLPGPLFADRARRASDLRYAERVRRAAIARPSPSVIVAYEWFPVLRVLADGTRDGAARYAYLLERAEADSLRAANVAVFDLPGAVEETRLVHGYDLRATGSRPMNLEVGP